MKTMIEFWREVWRTNKTWVICRFLCPLVWALDLFWIQGKAFETVPWMKYPLLYQGFRLFLDLSVTLLMVLLLRRRILVPLISINLMALTILGTYSAYFHGPLLPIQAYHQWKEGWSMSSHLFNFIAWDTTAVLLGSAALQFWLLWKSGYQRIVPAIRRGILALFAVIITISMVALQATSFKLSSHGNANIHRAVYAYGYTLPWIFDILANRDIKVHVQRAHEYLEHRYDRLSPLEPPVQIPGHFIVLQLESVGGNAITAEVDGKSVMPFLNNLKEESMYFRIESFHRNGSCDMDYAATTGYEPYPGMVPYRLPGMVYTNALPSFMEAHGFTSSFYHGNTALFYDRGPVMKQLGFDHIYFKEQLVREHLPTSAIGVRDAALFNFMLQEIRSESRAYIFAVTLDTHTPFQQLQPTEMELFSKPQNSVERYINALHYLDDCLHDFFQQLPPGTTLVLYGDHTASINSDLFQSDVSNGKEYIPCLIHQTGTNLALLQQTRTNSVSTNGTLNLLDIMSYLRRSRFYAIESHPGIKSRPTFNK
jgi:hypothetical protein